MQNRKNLLFLVFIFLTINILSQPGPPQSPCWPPPCVPIDGGISLFTFISILIGYKFLSKKNNF